MAKRLSLLPTLPHLLASPQEPLIHRDLSGLQFNERVLAEARSSSNPLFERVKFLSITASNLDEFFMIRYASLDRSIRNARTPLKRRHLIRVRNSILESVAALTAKQAETLDLLASALEAHGIRIIRALDESDPERERAAAVFRERILPELPPPEPFRPASLADLGNTKVCAVFSNRIWVRIPRQLPGFLLEGTDPVRLYALDDLLAAHLGQALRIPGTPALLRVTRDGDIPMEFEEEDPLSIPDMVRSGLGSRDRGRPVRLQYAGDAGPDLLGRCLTALRLSPRQVLPASGSLYVHSLWSAASRLPAAIKEKPALSLPALDPFMLGPLSAPGPIFDELASRDLLLHHPYESFEAYVNFIRSAAADPLVSMIQQTVYRTDALSPVIETLKEAAARKKVRVLIELRARFDEMNNLRMAEELRKAGVEVAFGLGRLKVHAKIALVTRREKGADRLYTHLSTGNYNAATARQYEDFAILTSDPDLGEDARQFFDSVCQGKLPGPFRKLVPAPTKLHRLLLTLIRSETRAARAGRPAYIFAKVNALVDPGLIMALYEASAAGVRVDLMVRGACSLIPGVKGLSENIRVVSLVDRFLEHSRIYFFAGVGRMYLSSADWMPRNFFSRLEVAFPVLDDRIFRYIREVVIPVYLADTVKGRELTPQGTWKKRSLACTTTARFREFSPQFVHTSVRAQLHFEELARQAYRGTPLSLKSNKLIS